MEAITAILFSIVMGWAIGVGAALVGVTMGWSVYYAHKWHRMFGDPIDYFWLFRKQ